MEFLLGFVAGIANCAFVAAALAYFKSPIERVVGSVATDLRNAGPRPSGSVFIPKDDDELARDRIVAENRAKGLDTPIADII